MPTRPVGFAYVAQYAAAEACETLSADVLSSIKSRVADKFQLPIDSLADVDVFGDVGKRKLGLGAELRLLRRGG